MIFMENVCLYCDPSVAHDFSQACISTHLELMQFHRHTLWLRSSLSVTEGIIFFEAGVSGWLLGDGSGCVCLIIYSSPLHESICTFL